jgi:hypothetical protein
VEAVGNRRGVEARGGQLLDLTGQPALNAAVQIEWAVADLCGQQGPHAPNLKAIATSDPPGRLAGGMQPTHSRGETSLDRTAFGGH